MMKFCVNTQTADSRPVEKSNAAVGLAAHGILSDVGLMTLRIGTGLCLLVLHGSSKLAEAVGYFQGHDWDLVHLTRSLGFPAPAFFAVCAALSESVGAFLVACGLYSRLAAAAVAFNMLVAIHADLRAGSSIEDAYLYAVPLLTLLLTGPGALSLDHLLQRTGTHKTPIPKEM